MVYVDDSSLPTGGLTAQVDWLGLRVGGHLALSLHSSYEPGELSQWRYAMWQHHKYRRGIIIIIIIIIIRALWCSGLSARVPKCQKFKL